MAKLYCFLLLMMFVLTTVPVLAQPIPVKDTLHFRATADSVLAKQGNKVKKEVTRSARKTIITPDLSLKNTTRKKTVTPVIDLYFGDLMRYRPLQTNGMLAVTPFITPQFVNQSFVQGKVSVAGVPLGFNFTNDQNSLTGVQNIGNSLFKFDFNPSQFNSALKNDLQQYYELRKNVFGGKDLTGYTQNALKDQLSEKKRNGITQLKPSALSQYISQPDHIAQLLELDEQQIKQQLHQDLDIQKTELPVNTLAQEQFNTENQAIGDLAANKKLAQYFNDSQKRVELKYMNEAQIKEKMTSFAPPDSLLPGSDFGIIDGLFPVKDFDVSTFVNHMIIARNEVRQQEVDHLSRQVFLSRISGGPVSLVQVIGQSRKDLDQRMPGRAQSPQISTGAITSQQIDSVARTITGIKTKLQAEGINVHKLLETQKLLKDGNGDVFNSEAVKALASNRPQNALQSLFTRVQSFKLGAFGENAPGSTQNKDLFLEGTHLTYQAGNIPVSIGYSGVNDIASGKDAGYQASNYNASKSLSYLSLKVNKGVFGSSSISIIGSGVNYINNYNNYAVPSAASNNVALTLSKLFNMGTLGKVTVDVSKSTTLFYKDLTPDNTSILDKKAGLDYSGSNLSQALSFGFDHQLDLQSEGLTEKMYFNYSGSGYQNPGNSGFGGGGTKFGGNVRKKILKNKLTLGLRTDFNNKSISYTSNDQWKTYQVQLDGRYNISKKLNVSLKYVSGGTDRQVDQINTPVYTSQKYQVDGNATYKIGKNYTVSHVTIGKQNYNNTYITSAGSSLLMVNYTQSLLLQANSLTLSAFYNKELSDYKLIGDMLNSELTYQYKVFRAVNLSTGIIYLNNTGIASQAGVRQGIQLLAGKNFDVDSYVDLRRNLITPLYPELYAACRAELSLKYHIKY